MRRSRTNRRRERQLLTWYPTMASKELVYADASVGEVTQDVLTVVHLDAIVEHEAVLERTRGSVVAFSVNTSIHQLIVAGCVVERKLADVMTQATANVPDLLNTDDGDDYFFWQSFACVDNTTSNYWNGREIDVKAKRRIERGDAIVYLK